MAKELGPKGLEIICFPCNQFGRQEPGSNEEIKKFVEEKFDFSGPGVNMMDKIDVNGANTSPVWKWLKEQQKREAQHRDEKQKKAKEASDALDKVVSDFVDKWGEEA